MKNTGSILCFRRSTNKWFLSKLFLFNFLNLFVTFRIEKLGNKNVRLGIGILAFNFHTNYNMFYHVVPHTNISPFLCIVGQRLLDKVWCISFLTFFPFRFAVDLLGLLKWNSMVGKLKTILVTVMKVSGEEIVKVCVHA